MINFILSHKIIVVVIAILVAVAVWIGLSSGGSSSDSLLTTDNVSGSGPDQELVATLLALRAVKLDGAIFSDPGFQNLKDFSTAIVPEPIGRPNPFAPRGSQAGASGATSDGQLFIPATPTKK